MTKFVLVLWMCSVLHNNCPSSTIPGYSFSNHYDCVNAGYAIAQKTYRALEELEEYDREYVEKNRIVVKFECRPYQITIPIPKPDVKTPA